VYASSTGSRGDLRYTSHGKGGSIMESYIEVTWISGFLILFNAATLAFYLAMKPCSFLLLIVYSACIPLLACFVFAPWEWLVMAGAEGFFFYVIYRHAWKSWLLMIAHRLLCNLTAYLLYGGSFHLGIYFVPCDTLPILLWSALIGSWLAMFLHGKWTLSQQNFIYPIEVRSQSKVMKMKGYMDSGNLMMSEGIPVMFLDQSYEAYFDVSGIQWVVMDTMQGSEPVRCCYANVRIANAPYHRVLVHFKKRMQLPLGAKALLNIHMMTQE